MTSHAVKSLAVGLLLPGLLLLCASNWARAEDGVLRVGIITDMSGQYADGNGPGSVIAAQMAAEEIGGTVAGRRIEIISADHQNKPDVGVGIVRNWIDNKQCRRHRRRRQVGGGAGDPEPDPRAQEAVSDFGLRFFRSHRQAMLADQRAVDLRHLRLLECDRQGGGRARRHAMVLPHRRLCVRPGAGTRCDQGRARIRRQGAGRGPPSLQHRGFFVVPAAGAVVGREDCGARQCRRGFPQRGRAGR